MCNEIFPTRHRRAATRGASGMSEHKAGFSKPTVTRGRRRSLEGLCPIIFDSGWLRLSALILVVVASALAAPIERELGTGLVYFRVHTLPDDLPAKPAGRVAPCIVD